MLFYYSIGSGHPLAKMTVRGNLSTPRPVSNRPQKVFFGLIEALWSDKDCLDMEELINDLGYSYKKAKRIYSAIENNNDKANSISLFKAIVLLGEVDQEQIRDGEL